MTMQQRITTAMLATKGAQYVAAWPAAIARRFGVESSDVIRALNLMTGCDVDPATPAGTLIPEVGALTPQQARSVAGQVEYGVRLREHADLQRRAPYDPAARARLDGHALGVSGEVWGEGQ